MPCNVASTSLWDGQQSVPRERNQMGGAGVPIVTGHSMRLLVQPAGDDLGYIATAAVDHGEHFCDLAPNLIDHDIGTDN